MSHKPDVKSLFKAARAQRESTGPAKLVCLQLSLEVPFYALSLY